MSGITEPVYCLQRHAHWHHSREYARDELHVLPTDELPLAWLHLAEVPWLPSVATR
jgi:hypothetical protein